MDNSIVLRRSMDIETWHILATVAKAQQRNEMMPLLKYLGEFSEGTIKGISEHLFFEQKARAVVVKRLLTILKLYELVDADEDKKTHKLTDAGKQALEQKRMFVPEDGKWEISASDDPLLPHQVLELKSYKEPDAYSEIIGDKKEELKHRLKNMVQIPDWFTKFIGKDLIPYTGREDIRIGTIGEEGEEIETKFSCRINWYINESNIEITEGKKLITSLKGPGLSVAEVWKILLENDGDLNVDDWNEAEEKMAVAFADADSSARKLMQREFKFVQPKIYNNEVDFGEFDDIVVKGVAICARTQEDAQKWARWRLDNSITGFASEKSYSLWKAKAKEPFKEFSTDLPTRDEAARALIGKKLSANDWYLVAAADWQL